MTASGSLTHDQMVAACRNIGFDLTCGACSGQFFTGSGMGEHTCPGAQAKMTRVGRDPKLLRKSVREMPRGELEKNYLCSLLQIDAYAMTGDRTHVLEAAILEATRHLLGRCECTSNQARLIDTFKRQMAAKNRALVIDDHDFRRRIMRRSVVNFQGVVRYLASRNVTKRQLTFLRKATAGAVIELEKLQSEASARQPRTILDLRSRILRLGGCGKKTVDQMLDILEDQKIIWSCPKCGEGVISSDLILQSLRQLRDHLAQA